jgi:predicted dehydrogenase
MIHAATRHARENRKEPAVRIAFFGAGDEAQPYLRALSRRADVEMMGICDADQRAAEEIAAGWGARVHADPTALLGEAPEAAWICTQFRQGELALECAQRRIPFFVIPPGSSDFERARATARALAGQKLVTAVSYPARHVDIVRDAREFLEQNPVPLLSATWVRSPGDDGARDGVKTLWADACILVDAMRWFNGDVAQVWARSTPDGGLAVQLDFENGTAGSLTCAAFPRPEPRATLELIRPDSTVWLENQFATLRLEEPDKTTILRRLNQPAEDAVAGFLQALEERNPEAIQPDYLDAFRTLAVCRAAAQSAEEKRAVDLAELV